MKIKMAVYTAVQGFDWQPQTFFSRKELNQFYEMIGDFPDIMMQKVPYGGAFVCDGRFVFYRFHVNYRGDFRGRDALYCVLGAVPIADAARFDLAKTLSSPVFAGPQKPFPTETDVEELPPPNIPKNRRELEAMVAAIASPNDLGACAACYTHGRFDCRITELDGRFSFMVKHENPDIVDPPPPPPPPRPLKAAGPVAGENGSSVKSVNVNQLMVALARLGDQVVELKRGQQTLLRHIAMLKCCLYVLLGLSLLCVVLTVAGGRSAEGPKQESQVAAGTNVTARVQKEIQGDLRDNDGAMTDKNSKLPKHGRSDDGQHDARPSHRLQGHDGVPKR